MQQTILVTGAGGYIGRHVVSALKDCEARVISLDVSSGPVAGADESVQANILDASFDISAYLDSVPDVCMHLAWRNGFDHNNKTHMEDLSGHYRFLSNLIDFGIPKIAVMGTVHEVGYWEGPVDENTPCNPESLYAIAKDSLRRAFLLRAKQSGIQALWLRGFYIYGDDERSQSIFGKLTRAAKEGKKLFPFTTGKNKYDFMRVEELANQISACIIQDQEQGIINCCTGEPETLGHRVECFIEENNLDIKLEYGAFPDRPYDSPGVWGDASRIKTILARR